MYGSSFENTSVMVKNFRLLKFSSKYENFDIVGTTAFKEKYCFGKALSRIALNYLLAAKDNVYVQCKN